MGSSPQGEAQRTAQSTIAYRHILAWRDDRGFNRHALDRGSRRGVAREAAEVLAEFTNQSLIELLARVEKKCRSPQGLAINALLANTGVNTISWFGAGNVKGILFHRNAAADPRWQRLDNSPENLGTGQCMLREMRVPVKPGDLIIFATEDVSDSYIEALPIDGKPRVVADALMSQYCAEGTDCAMVVVRFLGAS